MTGKPSSPYQYVGSAQALINRICIGNHKSLSVEYLSGKLWRWRELDRFYRQTEMLIIKLMVRVSLKKFASDSEKLIYIFHSSVRFFLMDTFSKIAHRTSRKISSIFWLVTLIKYHTVFCLRFFYSLLFHRML